MNIESICEAIKQGLSKGYKQNLLLLSSYGEFLDHIREYLLTVNVAQHLLDWNENNQYKINIEYPVLSFYTNAFPSSRWEVTDIFNMEMIVRQTGHSPTETFHQKLDLAITEEKNENNMSINNYSKVGIELKGISKNSADILHDARRLAGSMMRTDVIGPNSIEFCCCGFIERLDKNEELATGEYLVTKKEELNRSWQAKTDALEQGFPDLVFSTEFFDIVHIPYEAIAEIHHRMESEYAEVVTSTGAVIGGLLKIERMQTA